jgi:hypothetical protein
MTDSLICYCTVIKLFTDYRRKQLYYAIYIACVCLRCASHLCVNVPRTRVSLPVMLLTGSMCHRRSQNDVWYINWPKSETWNNRRINHLMEVIWSILRSGKCLRGVLCLTSQEPGVVTYFLLHWCRLYSLVTHFLSGVSPDFSVVMDASVRAL